MQQLLFENTASDFKDSNQNRLNIECGFGLFKAIVYNPISKEIIWACEKEATGIEQAIAETNLQKSGYENVHINLINPYSTLIPNQLFEENYLSKYLNYNFETIENTICSFDSLKTIEAKNCYLLFEKEKEGIFKLFNNARIGHQSTAFIELNRSTESIVTIEMHPTHFQLMHMKNNEFKVFNCFAYENVEDLLYYITYALKQLNVVNKSEINIAGWIDKDHEIYKKLAAYFPKLKITKANPAPLKPGCIPLNQMHHFNQVIRQHVCV